jgi:DNA-directed RNA polymerase specialized sigma24 family protein
MLTKKGVIKSRERRPLQKAEASWMPEGTAAIHSHDEGGIPGPRQYSALSTAELLKACAKESGAGLWEELIRRWQPLIAGVVARCARRWSEPSRSIHEELVQDAWFKLFREKGGLLQRLAEVREEVIPGYLRVFTANLVHDYFRSLHANKRRPSNRLLEFDDAHGVPPGPAAAERIERDILLGRINELLEARTSGPTALRDRQIFWFHYRHGMTAREIASIPYMDLTDKGIESVLFRLTALVRQELSAGKGR